MSKPVRIREFVSSQVDVIAEAENRSFANTVEVLLLAALTERGVGSGSAGADPETSGVRQRGTAVPSGLAPRSVSPADVAATVPGVETLRPHMRKDRPALQCESRVFKGGFCVECGAMG